MSTLAYMSDEDLMQILRESPPKETALVNPGYDVRNYQHGIIKNLLKRMAAEKGTSFDYDDKNRPWILLMVPSTESAGIRVNFLYGVDEIAYCYEILDGCAKEYNFVLKDFKDTLDFISLCGKLIDKTKKKLSTKRGN